MNLFVSLLRGVNVSGHNMIRMAELKALYESLGLADVSTYIQSGNVVLRARRNNPAVLGSLIERAIEERFGFPVVVLLRRPAELARIIRNSPFIGREKIDEQRLYVTFLKTRPSAFAVGAAKEAAAKSPDQYEIAGSEIYLHCPHGYGKTLLSNTFFEKQLKVMATTRNWRTVMTLHAMAIGANR
jgi:uncharacterized protein (DUF1697 family)